MTVEAPGIQLAERCPERTPDFTNRDRPERKEKPAKPAKKLTRVPFTVSRLMEFCNPRELVNQTGHDVDEWPLVVLKELVDNALDACEEAGIAPAIEIAVDGDTIVIFDNGPGIPEKTVTDVLDYTVRVSSREAYVSPTRGAQGNALKTIVPMGYVLDGDRGEDASGVTVIETRGIAHTISFSADHIPTAASPRSSSMGRPTNDKAGHGWRHSRCRQKGHKQMDADHQGRGAQTGGDLVPQVADDAPRERFTKGGRRGNHGARLPQGQRRRQAACQRAANHVRGQAAYSGSDWPRPRRRLFHADAAAGLPRRTRRPIVQKIISKGCTLPAALEQRVRALLAEDPTLRWDDAVKALLAATGDGANSDITQAQEEASCHTASRSD
jgi:hypothetical protein